MYNRALAMQRRCSMSRPAILTFILVLLAFLGAACSGDGGSTELEPTIATETPESTAEPTATAEPQPTPSPPQGTPPAIDTSAWLTYTSPLGIEVRYPPGWTIVGPDVTSQPPSALDSRTYMNNGVFDDTREAGGTPGVVRVMIRQYPREFDAAFFRETCEIPPELIPPEFYDGPADRSIDLTVAGRQAVLCERHGISPAGLEEFGLILKMSVTNDTVVEIVSRTIGPTGNEKAVVRAIIDSVSLTALP